MKSGINSGVNYQDAGVIRGVTRGKGGHNSPDAESLCEQRITVGGAAPRSPNNVTSTFYDTVHLLPNDIRFEHGGAKLASCPGALPSLFTPWVRRVLQQIISLLYPVTSRWWVSILDRCCMKLWNSTLKLFTQLKLITSPDKYFLFLWNNVYEFLGTSYCIPKQWPMGPLQLSLPPLAQTPSYATAYRHVKLHRQLQHFD